MLVKFQKPLKIGDTTYKAGDTVDLEETQANILIAKGLAIKQPVEPKQKKKKICLSSFMELILP